MVYIFFISTKGLFVMKLKDLIEEFGGRTAFARKLGVSPQAVHKWEKSSVPPARALQIEKLTSGKVLAIDLVDQTAAV